MNRLDRLGIQNDWQPPYELGPNPEPGSKAEL